MSPAPDPVEPGREAVSVSSPPLPEPTIVAFPLLLDVLPPRRTVVVENVVRRRVSLDFTDNEDSPGPTVVVAVVVVRRVVIEFVSEHVEI